MTAVYDNLSAIVEELICHCHQSQRRFKAAAEATRGSDLKRLLKLYSNQRTRFAGELQAHYSLANEVTSVVESLDTDFNSKSDSEILESCIHADESCMDTYRKALKIQATGRARFLIAAQYSLLQQVQERMKSLSSKIGPQTTTATHVL